MLFSLGMFTAETKLKLSGLCPPSLHFLPVLSLCLTVKHTSVFYSVCAIDWTSREGIFLSPVNPHYPWISSTAAAEIPKVLLNFSSFPEQGSMFDTLLGLQTSTRS